MAVVDYLLLLQQHEATVGDDTMYAMTVDTAPMAKAILRGDPVTPMCVCCLGFRSRPTGHFSQPAAKYARGRDSLHTCNVV